MAVKSALLSNHGNLTDKSADCAVENRHGNDEQVSSTKVLWTCLTNIGSYQEKEYLKFHEPQQGNGIRSIWVLFEV